DCSHARWAAGSRGGESRQLAEVFGAQHAWGDHRKHCGIGAARVVKPVEGAASNAQHLTWADIVYATVDRPRQHALEAVDCLLVGVVAMGNGHTGVGGHVKFEHRQRAGCGGAFEQEPDFERPDPDVLSRANHLVPPGVLTRSRCTILTCGGRGHRLDGCGSRWPSRSRWDWPSRAARRSGLPSSSTDGTSCPPSTTTSP